MSNSQYSQPAHSMFGSGFSIAPNVSGDFLSQFSMNHVNSEDTHGFASTTPIAIRKKSRSNSFNSTTESLGDCSEFGTEYGLDDGGDKGGTGYGNVDALSDIKLEDFSNFGSTASLSNSMNA
jgi:hypothetical protein